jgi:folate-binding protein YgfZ
LNLPVPATELQSQSITREGLGEIYSVNHRRIGLSGFDLFVPADSLAEVAKALTFAATQIRGGPCGWQALETARIEAGIPRFGAEMDSTNLPPETGIESRAISYSKGCYIGQEIIARIRTYGQVAKALRGFRLREDLAALPAKGDKIYLGNKEVGYLCSAVRSPALNANIALGYVRREHNEIGTELRVRTRTEEIQATIVEVPFVRH